MTSQHGHRDHHTGPRRRNQPTHTKETTMQNKSGKAALIVAIAALLSSLAGFAPAAGFILTSSKQIKPGVVLSSDIHKGGVRSSDIATSAVTSPDIKAGAVDTAEIDTGAVTSPDIGANQVTPSDIEAPPPVQVEEPSGGQVQATSAFTKVDDVTTYAKQDPTSVLAVDWTGTARAGFSPCVFQLRVNGSPSSAAGGGEVFVNAGSTQSVAASALFEGLATGPVSVEVWARSTVSSEAAYPCTAGPADTIGQTFTISEQVI